MLVTKEEYAVSPEFNYHISPISKRETLGVGVFHRVGRVLGLVGAIPPHAHRFYEWVAVSKGTLYSTVNGVTATLTAGDIHVSFPGDSHSIRASESDPPDYDFVSVELSDPNLISIMAPIAVEYGSADSRVIRSERIKSAVASIIAEANERAELYESVLDSLTAQLCAYTVRKLRNIHIDYSRGVSGAESLCYRIMNYINTNIYTIKKLSDVCAITCYNYNYLSNLFKRVTSKTLMEYYTERRLECANLHLAEGKHTITEIAEMLGYSSVYVFSRAYKKHFGISPTEYVGGK